MKLIQLHDNLTYAVAVCCVPFMRLTGFRFSKAWRGNKIVSHVAANLLADGIKPNRMKY